MVEAGTVVLNTIDDTKKVAVEIAAGLQAGDTVALCGELGSGKTTFTAMVALALGSRVPVSSPTYVLQHEYPTSSGLMIEHWDVYRVTELPAELENEPGRQSIRIIEWADRFPVLMKNAKLTLHFQLDEKGLRILSFVRNPN